MKSLSIDRPLRAVLLMAMVGPSLNFSTVPTALPLISIYLGGGAHGEALAQQVLALPFLGLAMGGLLTGAFIARWGLKRCLLGAASIYACAGLIGALSHSVPQLLLSCLILGFSASVISGTLIASTGAIMDDNARTRILGFQSAAGDFSSVFTGLMAATLAQAFGWRAPFGIFVLFGFLVLSLVMISRFPSLPRSESKGNGLLVVAKLAFSSYFAAGFVCIIASTQGALLPFHLAAHGLTAPTSCALVLTSATVASMLTSICYALNRGRISDHHIILLATAAAVIGYSGMAIWHGGLIPIVVAAIFAGISAGCSFPMVIRSVLRRTPSELHGYAMGLLNTSIFLGGFISPVIFGALLRLYGARMPFYLCAALCFFVGMLALRNIRSDTRRVV